MKDNAQASAPLLSDEEILALYRARDEAAIRETERKYGTLLSGLSHRILSDRRDCEECVSDTYLRLWQAIPPACPQSLRAYAVKTLRSLSIDRYRENHRGCRVPPALTISPEDCIEQPNGGDLPDEYAQAAAVGALISRFLHSLPEKRRYIFLERVYMAEPVENIARALSLTKSAVYKELNRTKEELKRYLAENGVYV